MLDGTWEGHYGYDKSVEPGRLFPITATLVQSGRILDGSMVDRVTESVHLYQKLVEAYEGEVTDQVRWQIQQTLMRSPDLTIESTLPKESRLRGKVSGARVQLTKTYQGVHEVARNDGFHRTVIDSVEAHRVEYRGKLEDGGTRILGRWMIFPRVFLGRFRKPVNAGPFTLIQRV